MSLRDARPYAILALLGAAVYLPALGSFSLWNPDEPRYAEVAREMGLAQDLLVPRLNGEVYAEKPPLMFWAIRAAGALRGGVDETATRLPSALAAIGTTLLAFAIGRRLFGETAGWIAAAALATNVKVLWQGRVGQIDMLLAFLVALAMYFWVRGTTERDPRWYPAFFVAAGLATLAKGPVGLLPPLLSILAFLAWTRDREGFRRLGLGPGLALWALVVLAWLVPAGLRAGEEYLREIALRQTVTRYLEPWHHYHPWYYYFTVIPVEFFPWSFFLPTAAVVGWRERRGPRRAGWLLALAWAAVTVLFFSVSSAKRDVYILTMYPALALLVGGGLAGAVARWPAGRGWLVWPLGLLTVVAATAAAAVPTIAGRFPRRMAVLGDEVAVGLVVALAVLAAGAAVGWVLTRRDRPLTAVVAAGAGAAATGFLLVVVLVPRLEPIRSLKPVAEALAAALEPGERYAIFPRVEPAILFYGERLAYVPEDAADLRRFLATPDGAVALVRESSVDRLEEPPPPSEAVVVNPGGDRPYILWRPDGGPPEPR